MAIAALVIIFSPAGLILAGIFLYRHGTKMEKQHEEPIVAVRQTRMNEYDHRVLEEMK